MSQKRSSTTSSIAYEQALERLYKLSLYRRGKNDNSNAFTINRMLGYPSKQFASIHIAGTNGKGSVATKVANALTASGLKVGLFTSPHLLSFCERVVINGKQISKADVVSGLNALFQLAEKLRLKPTFFELLTVMACVYFCEHKVDVAVFEVGVGGRLDATQIIDPMLSIITNISNDHAWVLGDTLDEIARQKAGIIRPCVPVVVGPHARYDVIFDRAEELGSPVISVPPIEGNFEMENRAIAKAALNYLKQDFSMTEAQIKRGTKTTPPCRFQRMTYQGRPVIVDVAHNPDALKRLLEAIRIRFPRKPLQAIFGISHDKDQMECLSILAESVVQIHLPLVSHYKLSDPNLIYTKLKQMGHAHASVYPSSAAALEAARKNDYLIVICGSFYMMESLIPLIENKPSTTASSA